MCSQYYEENNESVSYTPINESTKDNASSPKKIKYVNSNSTFKPSHPRPVRILGRRYPLTSTSYKYLEIGIAVGPISTVEIILGDNRGTQLLLPAPIWDALIEKRAEIKECVLSVSSDSPPIWIEEFVIEFTKIHNVKLIKFSLANISLYYTIETLNNLFNHVKCINLMRSQLFENTHRINIQFINFVNVLKQNGVTPKTNLSCIANMICNSKYFDDDSLIDCELLACALNILVYTANI
ncbi:uncharacterized protein LOC143188738 [Calliopsis andreniformis]|uniref:uncharacterized protein LOC143188738 n=1 Tax=Calliopsis andreniformis TaxID=337506 RepID=UPI003FCDD2D8